MHYTKAVLHGVFYDESWDGERHGNRCPCFRGWREKIARRVDGWGICAKICVCAMFYKKWKLNARLILPNFSLSSLFFFNFFLRIYFCLIFNFFIFFLTFSLVLSSEEFWIKWMLFFFHFGIFTYFLVWWFWFGIKNSANRLNTR